MRVTINTKMAVRHLVRVTVGQRVSTVWSRPADNLRYCAVRGMATQRKEEIGLGDYPVLPWRSAQLNRPRGWWDDQDRRDKETPVHEEEDALNVWMYDAVENNGKYTRWQALGQLVTALSLLAGLYGLSMLYDAPSRNPAVRKEYPFDNLYLERGGDPERAPTEAERKEEVHRSYNSLTS